MGRASVGFRIVALSCLIGAQAWAEEGPIAKALQGALGGDAAKPAPAAEAPAPAPTSRQAIESRRADVDARVKDLRAEIAAAPTGGPPAATQRRAAEILDHIALTLGQSLAALDQIDEHRRRKAEPAAANGAGESPSFLVLERMRDELDGRAQGAAIARDGVAAAQAALDRAKSRFEDRERARRKAREDFETAADPAAKGAAQEALRIARLESEAADEERILRELELRGRQLDQQSYDQRTATLKAQVAQAAAGAVFTRQDLDQQLAAVDKREFDLQRNLNSAKLDLDAAERRFGDAQRRLDRAPEATPALVEEVAALRLARDVTQRRIELLGQELQRLSVVKSYWDRRFRVFSKRATGTELRAWERDVAEEIDALTRASRLHEARLGELRGELANLDARRAEAGDPKLRNWIDRHKAEVQGLVGLLGANARDLDSTRRLATKLQGEIRDQIAAKPVLDRVRDVLDRARELGRYELVVIDDHPITAGKTVVALVLLTLGVRFSRRLSRLLARHVYPRIGASEGTAVALETLTFYAFIATSALAALNLVHIPLTIFTFLGGALAIGVGFGSQNLLNNFISGLILLTEQPIRVGDMVEVDGTFGRIERVGARSTQVRTFTSVDILVPNSAFLEKNVVNWTLTDDRVRVFVSVGVAYGSPTREVAKLLRKAADDHGKILKVPEPIVVFRDFGDSALIFEIHFWIRMRRPMDARTVESDMRFQIDNLFRDAGVTIAFPQRDVHFHPTRPLDVRVIAPGAEAAVPEDKPRLP
ncbi:MAG: mechanosensitive ion channel [Myxococcales bacterium]|nr:mechanosensitive ion channel [Myxococcales bacterium]